MGKPTGCAACGRELPPSRTKPRIYCTDPECTRLRDRARHRKRDGTPDVEHHTCTHCGTQWTRPPTKGDRPKYCPDCRLRQPRECRFCGVTFHALSWSPTEHCSIRCSQRTVAGWSTSKEIVHVPTPSPLRAKHLATKTPPKRIDWWQVIVCGSCPRCSAPFTALAAGPHQRILPRYCSDHCARADAKDRRRAIKVSAFVAAVYRAKVFERDGWKCQLCGKPTRRRASVPDPLAPTIDHIVPLSRGGTHQPANVQCAHFICNARKGAGGGNEQLLLVG